MGYELPLSNHIAISQLDAAQSLSNDSIILISERTDNTRTGYITKKISYNRMKESLDRDFDITLLSQNFVDLCSITYPIITGLETNYVSCENIGDVYIISSIYQSCGNISSVYGYRLSSGIDYYFKNMTFDEFKVNCLTANNIKSDYLTNNYYTKPEIDNLTANTLNNAKNYTDTVIEQQTKQLTNYYTKPEIDNLTANTLNNAKNYTDTVIEQQTKQLTNYYTKPEIDGRFNKLSSQTWKLYTSSGQVEVNVVLSSKS